MKMTPEQLFEYCFAVVAGVGFAVLLLVFLWACIFE